MRSSMIRWLNWNGFESGLERLVRWMPLSQPIGPMAAKGLKQLAKAVVRATEETSTFRHLYDVAWPIKKKIETIATQDVWSLGRVVRRSSRATRLNVAQPGFDQLPICMAKTPLSLSHDPALKGRPTGFTLPIKEVRMLAGAGFLTAVCSGIQLMPGLPKKPAGERIGIDPGTGEIVGLS